MFCINKDGEMSPEVDDECEGRNLRERVIDNTSGVPGDSINRPDNEADHENQVHYTFPNYQDEFYVANT